MDKNGIYLQLYKRAPAPNRDYYGLTITKNDVILNIWNITHGPHVFPKKQKCPLQDFPDDGTLKAEIERLFGKHVVEYCNKLSKHDPALECMPTKVFLFILRHLATNDILNLGQTSKIFFELCNSDSSWKLLFKKRIKQRSRFDDLENSDVRGWKNMLMTEILLQERTTKKKPEQTSKVKASKLTQDIYKSRIINTGTENSRQRKKVSFHMGIEDKKEKQDNLNETFWEQKEENRSKTSLESESSSLLLRKSIRDCLTQKDIVTDTKWLKDSLSNIISDKKKIPLNKTASIEKEINPKKIRNDQNREIKAKERNYTKQTNYYKYENKKDESMTKQKQLNEANYKTNQLNVEKKMSHHDEDKNPFVIPDSFYDLPNLKKPQKLFKTFTLNKKNTPINLNNAKVVNEFKDAVNNKSNLVQSKSDVNFINNKKDFQEETMRVKSAKEKNVNLKNGGSLRKGKGFSVKLK